jgi:hypothetical protein
MKTNLKSEVRGSKGEVRGGRNAGIRVGAQFGTRHKVGALVDKNAGVTNAARPESAGKDVVAPRVPTATCNFQPEFAGFDRQRQHSTLQDSVQNTDGFWE